MNTITYARPARAIMQPFYNWLNKTHPGVKLANWQRDAAELIFSQKTGAGKTFLVTLLVEYAVYADKPYNKQKGASHGA